MMKINSNNYENFNVIITITEEYNKLVHFAGFCNKLNCDDISFVIKYGCGDSIFESEISENIHASSYFTDNADTISFAFDFNIPFIKSGDIDFYIRQKDGDLFPVKLKYDYTSRINDLKYSFFIGENVLVTRTEKDNSFSVEKLEYEKLCNAVNLYIDTNFQDEKYEEDRDILQRYLSQYNIMSKRKIWLITDRRDRADDNGEYFFRHSIKIDDGIEKYFVVDKKSPDYERLGKIGNVVAFGSAEHKLLHLFCEKFISAQLNTRLRDYWNIDKYILYAGLDRGKNVFLQHGVILHEISGWLKRATQNLKLFVTSSPYEYNSVLKDNYGYDKSVVKLTGMPRYDSLHDDNKKKIFFAPTWRFSVFNIPKNEFQETDYCKRICQFLCDKKLIDEAKRQGYEILFKPHPMLADIASYFEVDQYVKIIPYDVSYQTLFAESSLFITDFSSTAFDFSYLKKPMIYYQFFENHMGKSYFDYENMGFGEVITEHDKIVEKVIEYMGNDCIMKEEYKHRVDDFFAYHDKNNSKRVYDEIVKM